MAQVFVRVDGRVIFDGDVPDWHPLPDIPNNPQPGSFTDLPRAQKRAVKQAMSKAAHAALDKALTRTFGE